MARLLTIPRSPFLYVEYRTLTGIRRESTKQLAGTREGQRNAHRILTTRQAQERALTHLPPQAEFSKWVGPWLRQHCANSPATLKAYLIRWNTLAMFFRLNGITHPSQITYQHCQAYLTWRTACPKEIKPVSSNTARDDLGTLRFILGEAMRRDFCSTNPCVQLRIKTAPRKVKPDITDEQAASIRAELANGSWPPWMQTQFEIAHHTGRRISETKIALHDLDLTHCTYTVRVKGGRIKTKPFHPDLLPFLRGLTGEFTHGVSVSHATRKWRELFDKLRMTHHTFHCCRVSMISRLRRAGVDRWTAMQVVEHASAAIHEHYNRYVEGDLRAALEKAF